MPDLNWASIGVCWTLTTVTTIAILAIWTGISHLRQRKRKRGITRADWNLSEKSGDLENGQSHPLLELKCPSTTKSNGVSSQMSSTASNASNDRRRQDDVTRWCSEHGLPETLVYTLRQQGFETKAALDSLRPEDLQGREGNPAVLQLPNKAVMVQLRNVLTKIHGTSRQDSSNRNSKRSNLSGVLPNMKSGETEKQSDLSPSGSSDVFLRTFDEVDGPSSHDDVQKRKPRPALLKNPEKENSREEQRFHGLLSDEGLWDLTKMIGHEWRQLATHLNVSAKTQERLRETNHHNISAAIHEVLVTWRDNCSEGKEQMKGQMLTALLKVDRKDIANKLMKEQLHGSYEKMNQKLTSVI